MLPLLLAGQTLTPVTVHVIDPSGDPVPHAKIRIVPAPQNPPPKMETNEYGEFSLFLRSGSYEVTVEEPGFKINASHLDVPDSRTTQTVPITLEVARGGGVATSAATASLDKLSLLAFPYHDPVLISRSEFASFPHITVTVINGHTDSQEVYSGVRVADLFAKLGAPLGKELRGKAMNSYIRGSASDNYQVVFSLAEIDPDFHPGEIIVADTLNGKPLDTNSGPFRLVTTEDKRPQDGSAT